jgi:phage-related tail protein
MKTVLLCLFVFCAGAQAVEVRKSEHDRVPSLLEVSTKLEAGAPADHILESLMKMSHNIHLDIDNDKTRQNDIRLDCQKQNQELNANLLDYASKESTVEAKLDVDGAALNASKRYAADALVKIQKVEHKVTEFSTALPPTATRINAAKDRLKEIDRMFSPEEQYLGRAVNESKALYEMVMGTFDAVSKLDRKTTEGTFLEVEEGARVGWASELTEMISKMTTNLEELHENSLETLKHKRDAALRDIEYQQMKVLHLSGKLNRTRIKLLKIQEKMDKEELKIANLTAEMSRDRFLLNRAKDNFRRASASLSGGRAYCKLTDVQYGTRTKSDYSRLEKINTLVDIVQQRVDAIRRVLVAAEKIKSGTIHKLGQLKLPHQASMEEFDEDFRKERAASGATGAADPRGATGIGGATGAIGNQPGATA